MNKKIFIAVVFGLLTFNLTDYKAIAGEATKVYLEIYKTTTYPFDKEPIRARAALFDSSNNLATTFNNQPITDAELIVRSLNFYGDVQVSADSYATYPWDLNFTLLDPAYASIDINSAWQEFALNYDNVPEPGDDVIRVTLKNGSATIFAEVNLKVIAPVANCYVVRTGGISSNALPNILEEIGPPQFNYGLPQKAGSSVKLDIFAAYGFDSTGLGGPFDTFIYTNNLPAGTEKVTVEGTEVTLIDGHAATSFQVKNLGISVSGTAAEQETALANIFKNGTTKKYSASSKIIPELGIKCSDVNTAGQIAVCGAGTFGSVTAAAQPPVNGVAYNYNEDITSFFPDVLSGVNIVGVPITGIDGTAHFSNGADFSPNDAYFYTNWITKAGTFKVNAPNVFAAVVGFDAYNNPAPFNTTAGDIKLSVHSKPGGATPEVVDEYTISPNTAPFVALVFPEITNDVYLSSGDTTLQSVIQRSTIDTATRGVDFTINNVPAPYVTSITDIPSIKVQAANGSIIVAIQGTINEPTFTMKVYKKTSGLVKVNKQNVFTPADSVVIPAKDANIFTAEQNVIFFTSANDEDLLLIFTGQKNQTVFAYPVAGAIISPADATAFPPSNVTVGISEASVLIDPAQSHDAVNICQFDVMDAFGNSYNFNNQTNGKDLKDSGAKVAVYRANGTTLFPGAVAEVNTNDVTVTFDKTKITKDDSKAMVKMTAGTKYAQFPLNIRLLKTTILGNKFRPISGIDDTPVQVNFGDQKGSLIPPVVNNLNPDCQQGSFQVEFTVTNGSVTNVVSPFLLTTTDNPYQIILVNPADVQTPVQLQAKGVNTGETTFTILTLNFISRTPVPSTSTSVPINTTTVPASTTTTVTVTTTPTTTSTTSIISTTTTPATTTTVPANTTTTTVANSTTTTTASTGCQIKSIQPSGIRIGFGLLPRIRRVTLTLNTDLESLGITCADLNIQNAPRGAYIISCAVSGDSIEATILFWGLMPGTYNINLVPCGSIPFVVTRF